MGVEEDGKMEGCAEAFLNNAVSGARWRRCEDTSKAAIGIGWGKRRAVQQLRRRRRIE